MNRIVAGGRKRIENLFNNVNLKLILAGALLLLIIALIVIIIIAANTRPTVVTVPKDYVYQKNVSIAGIDIGGKNKEQAENLLKQKESQLLDGIVITIGVNDKELKYKASDLNIDSNLETDLQEAMLYAKMGSAYKDAYKVMTKTGNSVNFALKPNLDMAKMLAKLKADTDKLNIAPVDAQVKFDQDKDTFSFIAEKKGAAVDISKLAVLIQNAVLSGKYDKITAPIKELQPEYTLQEVKDKTKKIASYTSSFAGASLHSTNRVFNIKKMTGIIDGQIIDPGETWSMNKLAGDRTDEKGWKDAPGIENGVYTDQPGGGVCQVSSTLYNAALIAELDIVDRTHHTWPSHYIPMGLDATISTGAPDLKIRNNKTLPIYIIAYVNSANRTVTVDIYGEPADHGYKVKYITRTVATELPPAPEVQYTDKDTNGDPINPGDSIKVRDAKSCIRVRVYKQYIDKKTGKIVRTTFMYEDKYRAKGALYYENPATPKKKSS